MSEQLAIEEAHAASTRVIVREKTQKGRHKNLTHPPANEVLTSELRSIITETLKANGEDMGWNAETCDNWALILIRDLRYGVPSDEVEGNGFPFVDAEMETSFCAECEEDE